MATLLLYKNDHIVQVLTNYIATGPICQTMIEDLTRVKVGRGSSRVPLVQ